jgi:hypothetical protein
MVAGRTASSTGSRRWSLSDIAARYPKHIDVSLDDLADMLSVIADGGIILLKALGDPGALPRQIMLYREFVRAVFSLAASSRSCLRTPVFEPEL